MFFATPSKRVALKNVKYSHLGMDAVHKKQFVASKTSLSDHSNVSDEEDEDEDCREYYGQAALQSEPLGEADFEDGQELEYDMWEGQFKLATALHPFRRDLLTSTSSWTHEETQRFAAKSLVEDLNLGEVDSLGLANGIDDRSPHVVDGGYRRGLFDELIRQASMPASLQGPRKVAKYLRSKNEYSLSWGEWDEEDLPFDQVQQLQEQVGHLAESQATTDDRYSKVKQENAVLNQKIHMLEEQIREVEVRSEQKLVDDQKRNRDIINRLEREKELEAENFSIKLQNLERDHILAEQEANCLKIQLEKIRLEKEELIDQLNDAQTLISSLETDVSKLQEAARRDAEKTTAERTNNVRLIEELTVQVDGLKQDQASQRRGTRYDAIDSSSSEFGSSVVVDVGDLNTRLGELETEVKTLKDKNRKLTETNEEMQALMLNRGLEEGRAVLFVHDTAASSSMSIAKELENLSDGEDAHYRTLKEDLCQVRAALKEQQDVNAALRGYIDGILMNIMEKYPELLEVKTHEK